MWPEEEVKDFLDSNSTTPEERDPTKPFLVRGEFIEANPDYDDELVQRKWAEGEIKRRERELGTSFFVNFDPVCNLHQLPVSEGGREIRESIVRHLAVRFIGVFANQFPNNPPSAESLMKHIQAAVDEQPRHGFQNGEVYIWLRGINLKDDFTMKLLLALKHSLEDSPITVIYEGQDYEIVFYGWGFRKI